ncbi:MAG: universal stress protein [Paracoccaceae bacterium]|jgi:nucleotide-binding universal stress UspA family protein|nr:universal stress protein [Paracoccaceae bacterium]
MAGTALHTIMLPVGGDAMGEHVFAHAAALARRFGSRVRVVHCHPRPQDLMPYGVVMPRMVRSQLEAAANAAAGSTADHMLAEFEKLASRFGLAVQDFEPGRATARFIEYEGKAVDAVIHFGRVADLICVPQPRDGDFGVSTLKAALFSSGRPVMLCPKVDAVPDTLGAHVTIGWNGSLEATRAVALAMPLIESAGRVTILSTRNEDHSATPEQLRRYLELKEVSSEIRIFTPRGGVVGRQLLEETQAAGADLMVMGAYHDSYERESIFGGNSQIVVDEARIPVVLVH